MLLKKHIPQPSLDLTEVKESEIRSIFLTTRDGCYCQMIGHKGINSKIYSNWSHHLLKG